MNGDDQLLVKLAVFGVTMSVMCTLLAGVFLTDNGDYSFDEISAYRSDLVGFSGESMLSSTPWVMTDVMTPWVPSMGTDGHTKNGWLYGESIDYPDIGKSADIRLDPGQKSAVPLQYSLDVKEYTKADGYQWWASGLLTPMAVIYNALGIDFHRYVTDKADSWNYTGYRYVFDPVLPFKSTEESGQVSTVDGELSIVWYSYNGQEGLSGGLEIYGGDIRLASYSAADIVSEYSTTSGYASMYDFDFQGTHLTLSIRFNAEAIESGMPLMQAWQQGDWSMAISSVSAGNFFDITGSTSFASTAGGMIETFSKIFTFNFRTGNLLIDTVLWLMVGLPMLMAMLCIALKLVNGFRVF